MEELEKWEDAKSSRLTGIGGWHSKQVNERKYAAGVQGLRSTGAEVEADLRGVSQAEGSESKRDDPALATLEPKLSEATVSKYAKLKPMQDDMAAVQKRMEAAVQKEDFVQALKLVTDLGNQVDAYNKALAELEQISKPEETLCRKWVVERTNSWHKSKFENC